MNAFLHNYKYIYMCKHILVHNFEVMVAEQRTSRNSSFFHYITRQAQVTWLAHLPAKKKKLVDHSDC